MNHSLHVLVRPIMIYKVAGTGSSSKYQYLLISLKLIEVITFMINKAKEIKKNKVSNYDASVKVGEKLVDKFIKPHLDKDKENTK